MTIGERGAALACIYCEYKEHDAQTPTNPLASLWPQLNIGEGQDAQLSLAENLYAAHGKAGTRPSLPEIQTLIQATVRNLDEVYILVDGLDECPSAKDRHTFIDSLDQLLIPPGRQEGRVHLLITSRLRNDMFQAVTEVLIRPSCSEIENLVRTALAKPGFFQSPQMRSKVTETLDLKNTIVGSIAFNAAGMFLAARLHLNSLESLTNVSEIRHALQTLPESLDKLYGDAWARILDQEHNLELLAQQTVSWLFLAERQLRTHELCHALAVQPEDGKFDFERLIAIEDIVRACKGLITVDKHSQIVRFVHSTAQQFFLRVHPQLFPKAQTKLAVTCVTYLNLDFFRVAPCDFVSLRAADARRVKQRF